VSRITEARNALILSQPFFGALALRLKVEESRAVESMAVDGKTIRYNPDWIEATPFDQVVGVTAHEVMHCAASHHARRGARDHRLFNVACDYAVNPLLIDAGFKLPDGALVRDDLRDLSAEEIYTRLRQEEAQQSEGAPEPQPEDGASDPDEGEDEAPGDQSSETDEQDDEPAGDDDGDDPSGDSGEGEGDVGEAPAPSYGGCGSFEDGPGDGIPATEAELAEQAREWEIATMQAVAAAKAAGQLPGAGQWLVKQITQPRINWREALRDFVTASARSEMSWVPPNRRYIHQGLYLPGPSGKEMGEMVVLLDTSGSCAGPLQDTFAAEFNGIVEDMRPERIHLIYWDTQLQGHREFEPDDKIVIEPQGFGGTDFSGIWQYIADQGIEPACLVGLTDLYASFGNAPDYPVLWCSTDGTHAPFGQVVKLQL
jgi:predicted metal-dependent peptidase